MPGKTLISHFPLTRPHCGSTLGNGLQGLLVQVRDGTIHVAERLPKRWRDLSFENLPVPGGFRLSAEIRHRQVRRIHISSTVGATLRLAPGFTGPWSLDGVPQDGLLLTLPTAPGQRYVMQGAVRTECVIT